MTIYFGREEVLQNKGNSRDARRMKKVDVMVTAATEIENPKSQGYFAELRNRV